MPETLTITVGIQPHDIIRFIALSDTQPQRVRYSSSIEELGRMIGRYIAMESADSDRPAVVFSKDDAEARARAPDWAKEDIRSFCPLTEADQCVFNAAAATYAQYMRRLYGDKDKA